MDRWESSGRSRYIDPDDKGNGPTRPKRESEPPGRRSKGSHRTGSRSHGRGSGAPGRDHLTQGRRVPPPRSRRDKVEDVRDIPSEGTAGLNGWVDSNRGMLFGVVVVATASLLILAGLMIWANDGEKATGHTDFVTTFFDGSSEVLVNSSYLGNDVFIRIPWNATITDARLKMSGALPPGRMNFETGKNPIDLDVGDVDGDLLDDVVVVNYEDSTLMVMKNNGDKTFTKSRTFEVGQAPIRIELVHLNKDDHIDALVLSEDSRDLRVMINDHIGGFMKRGEPFGLPTLPSDLQIIDIEGDGDMDVIISTINDHNISLYVNDGNGDLVMEKKILTDGNPTRMAIADMDNDGLDDIVVSNRRDLDETIYSLEKEREVRWFNSVSFLHNNGDLSFSKMVDDVRTQKGISSIALGDLNGDGYRDVAMSNLGYHNMTLILSNGTGDYQRGSSFELDVIDYESMDPIEVMIEDLDMDGDLDVWALTRSADSILFYPNDGTGSLQPFIQSFIGVNPTSFDMMDFDGDGDLDIITSDWKAWEKKFHGNGTISVLENMRDGVFRTYRQYPTGNSPRGVFARDIDLDGDIDISSANYFGSTVSVLANNGNGRFKLDHEYPIGLEPYAVVLEDFDSDGYVDGASADEANFRIVLLRSDKDGGFTTERFLYDIGAYPFSLRTTDIDGDGDIDMYTSNYFQNSTTLLMNDGSGDFETMFRETITVYLGDNMPYDSLIEDINGDGMKDLITVNRGNSLDPSDTISVMINDGTYSFTDMVEYKVGTEPASAIFLDLDNDGDLDIGTANVGDDTFTTLINDGSGAFSLGGTYPTGDRPQYINTMDIDSDGWLDIIVSSSDSNTLTFFRNDNRGGFTLFSDLNIGAYPYAIDIADFNSDGRDDLVLTSVNTNSVIVTGCYYYPTGVSINVGVDADTDYFHAGPMTSSISVKVDITDELNSYIRQNAVEGEELKVPLRVVCKEEGVVSLSNLLIVYSQP